MILCMILWMDTRHYIEIIKKMVISFLIETFPHYATILT